MVYLQTTYELCFGEAYFEYFESCDFSRENTNIDVSVFMFDLRMINMSSECEYDLILKNISLLDRIWSLWLVRFAHSPTNFIFWLGRLIFSVSINSHPDYIYILENSDNITCVCLSRDYLVTGDNFPSRSTSVRWKIIIFPARYIYLLTP
jgi:hypothetical protein